MSSIIVVDPVLTGVNEPEAGSFNELLINCLHGYCFDNRVSEIKNNMQLQAAHLSKSDAIVIYNSIDLDKNNQVLQLLESGRNVGCKVYPIALKPDNRKPLSIISGHQSYDIHDRNRLYEFCVFEQLEHRDLPTNAFQIIAAELSRGIISELRPTFTRGIKDLFISYRRVDGEDLAFSVDILNKIRGHKTFRDLNIRTGADAQDIIEKELSSSEVVIFLDTPLAGESEWIERELKLALSWNIPIVWVQITKNGEISNLKVAPAKVPSFKEEIDVLNSLPKVNQLIDQIIAEASKLQQQRVEQIFNYIGTLIRWKMDQKITFEEIEENKQIYEIKIKRPCGRYPELPRTNLVQIFGRIPDERDIKEFRSFIQTKYNKSIDAGIMVGLFPGPEKVDSDPSIDGIQEFVSELQKSIAPPSILKKTQKGIVISGSFPNVSGINQQRIIDAVNIFSRIILDRGFILIFGGHPTFTPLILEMGRQRKGLAAKEFIYLYQSRFYVNDADVKRYEEFSRVTLTNIIINDRMENDRYKSLTEMREVMIGDKEACALIVIGGQNHHDGYTPGVGEEVEIALKNNLPVFLVGGAGGYAYELADRREGWGKNGLSDEDNVKLKNSIDFEAVADLILSSI